MNYFIHSIDILSTESSLSLNKLILKLTSDPEPTLDITNKIISDVYSNFLYVIQIYPQDIQHRKVIYNVGTTLETEIN